MAAELIALSEDGADVEQTEAPVFTYPAYDGDQTLTADDEQYIVDWILKRYKRFEKDRKDAEERWEEAEKVIQAAASKMDEENAYSTVTFGKQTLNVLLGHFWQRSLQTPKLLFNLEGMTEQTKDTAPLYKAWLDRKLEKNRVRQKLDDANEQFYIPRGVVIAHVGVCEEKHNMFGLHQSPSGLPAIGEYMETQYVGADVTIIDPMNFVFDTEAHHNWDDCFKAYQTWMEFEEIADSSIFTNLEELEEEVKGRGSATDVGKSVVGGGNSDRAKQKKEKGVDGEGRIEVLEFHGAIRMQDGTYLRNWTAVIAKRKHLIRFEKNPYCLNPYVKKCYEETKDGWGISPIVYIFPHVNAATRLLNGSIATAELNMNPQYLATKAQMPQKKIPAKKGQVIEYNHIENVPMPQPLQYRNDVAFPYLQLFEGQAEATTGATRQMSGNVTTNDKVQTATEFQGLQVVGNMLLDRMVDRYTIDFKLPLIERFAKIDAIRTAEMVVSGEYEPELIKVESWDGYEEYKQITLDIMFGRYDFVMEDVKAEQERAANFEKDLQAFQMFLQTAEGPKVNVTAFIKRFIQLRKMGKPSDFVYDDKGFVEKMGRELAMANLIKMEGQVLTERLMNEILGPVAPPVLGAGAGNPAGILTGGAGQNNAGLEASGNAPGMGNVVPISPELRQSGA